MVRRSTRTSRSGTTSTSKQHKRALSESANGVGLAKRTKQTKSTPVKSEYFATQKTEAEGADELEDHPESSPSLAGTTSEFDEATEAVSEESDASQSDFDDEEVVGTSAKAKVSGGARAKPSKSKEGAQWKPGVKTGLGPGTQVIIKKPKARPAGKTPYADDTIHPNTLLFLSELKENNRREWLKLNDPNFRQAEKDWHTFVENMTESLATIDDTIPELPVKDVVFRIYRDIRFSKDPTPSRKAWFSVAWSRAGRKGPFAHYYIQCAPNNSFVGGGLWHPDAAPTAAMRRAIDRHPRRLKDVLLDPRIRKEFLKGAAATDKAIAKAFVQSNSGNALKTKPKGYDAGHADIDLLRLRNYTIGRQLTDDEVVGETGKQRIIELLTALQPFITYLNGVVMPDEQEESSDEDEEEGDEEEDDSSNVDNDEG
ncbi:hypothetical protein Slin14017_G013330 [Septoria linicola]|nr:hypothetical protein Slin14017_G013330 [Septoria linicola]